MSKKFLAVTLAMAFMASTAVVSFAAKVECEVTAVDGKTVTMKCDDADKMKAGDSVKVSVGKKKAKKAIEGC